jgi:hypothetical protein
MSGGGQSTTTSSSTVPQTFLNAYNSTVNRASNVASTPYQAYTGNLVAGFNGQQTLAQAEVQNNQTSYQPLLNQAESSVGSSTKPLWSSTQQFSPSSISQYESPYQSQVIGATEAQINNTDAQQQAQLAGNAASSGALGGDREGVAQGILGGQQAIANNSTLAGLNNQNYSQALGEFNQQQGAQLGANEANSWLNSQAGYAYGNLANEGNNLAMGNASALAASGLTEQQQEQAGLNTQYEQWQAQQAFPYQQTGWLANITEGIGSNVGGSSTTTQTNNAGGGRVPRANGGIVPQHYDGGGGILSDIPNVSASYIPSINGAGGGGRGVPNAPSAQVQQNPWANPATDIGAVSGGVSLYNNLFGGGSSAAATPVGFGNAGMAAASTGQMVPATDIGSAAFAPGVDTLTMPANASVAATSPGFFGTVGNALTEGASSAADAIGSGAEAIGSAAVDAGSSILSSLGDVASFIAALFNKGGAVEAPSGHAGGGIVVPFPQRRAAGGGIGNGSGNYGEMPYSMPPPVQLQSTSTDGGSGYIPTGSTAAAPTSQAAASPYQSSSGGGLGGALDSYASSGGFGILPMMLSRGGQAAGRAGGGIVIPFPKHFDDGGSTQPDDAMVNQMRADEAAGEASDSQAASAPPTASIAVPSADGAPAATYQPQKPGGWIPILAGVATAALGRHHDASHNVAEGVLAGLGTYGNEQKQYQEGAQKAATIQQEANRLADDAEFHREQIANENKKADAQASYWTTEGQNSAARVANEAKYQSGELGLRGQEVSQQGAYQQGELGIRGQEAQTRAAAEQSLESYRSTMAGRGNYSLIGTTPDGQPVYADKFSGSQQTADGNLYTGIVRPTAAQQGRLDNQQQGLDIRRQALAVAHNDREQALAEHGNASTLFAATNIMRADPTGKTTLEQAYTQADAHNPSGGTQPQQPAERPAQQPQAAAQQPKAAAQPAGVGQWMQNKATGQWRSPTGQIFDASGNPVQ